MSPSGPNIDLHEVEDVNIQTEVLADPPAQVRRELPDTSEMRELAFQNRLEIRNIMDGKDPRILVVMGLCSVVGINGGLNAAFELVDNLHALQQRDAVKKHVKIVFRAPPHKPRTISNEKSWDGMAACPWMDGSHDTNRGVRLSRELGLGIARRKMPWAIELLDEDLIQYLPPLALAWIGARTVESPDLRKLASGISAPVGFKNATSGDTKPVLDAIESANHANWFRGLNQETGRRAWFKGRGNKYAFAILRGGPVPNYDAGHVDEMLNSLRTRCLRGYAIADAAHMNSQYDIAKQPVVFMNIIEQHLRGNQQLGVMMECNLVGGAKKFSMGDDPTKIEPRQSVTDPCIPLAVAETLVLDTAREKARMAA